MSGDGGGLEARLRERRGLVAAERAAADEELAQQPTNQPKKQKKQSTHQKKSANQPKNEENMKKYQRNLYLKLLERRQIGSVLILKEIFDHFLPHTHTIMKTTIFATF